MTIRLEACTTAVSGFRFAGAPCGIKKNGKPDVALAVADADASVGGVFTTNLVRAAPVVLAARRVAGGRARAVLANSGCANACTGIAGDEAALASTDAVARAIGVDAMKVIPASTGVIGAVLPADRIAAGAAALCSALSPEGADRFAEAILTTDRGPKTATARGTMGSRDFVVLGMAKGAGMIHPAMAPLHATMLAFLFTDATAGGAALTRALARVADATFNQTSVDGDTSTNDTLIALASGPAAPKGDAEIPGELEEAFAAVCEKLSRDMAADGEGAEHLVEIVVTGTATDDDARRIARTIATSPLVKTALFGKDANWGRILAAAGRAGVPFDPGEARIAIGNVTIVEHGLGLGQSREDEAKVVLSQPSYRIDVTVGRGKGTGRYLGCDLGIGYIRCNADYRS
jgi:glutamate N-acetyltransferase / amino-acid N-acetyltransferase